MRFEQLNYLEAVARLGSLRRAAEELHISQPALSETLRNLERELGVDVLVRTRTGARISDEGRELFPHVLAAIDAVDALRRVAHDQHHASRLLRVATVNAATATLVAPALREFHRRNDTTQVEVLAAQQDDIHRLLLEGSVDLGLVNYLDGDDFPPELDTVELLRGDVVVCMRPDDPLASRDAVTAADLLTRPLIAMRSGYVMHRFLHRLLRDQMPRVTSSTDGAELGKLLVAEGLGVTLLPRFSVMHDPLERHGVITHRPLAGSHADVLMTLQQRRSGVKPLPVRQLQRIFVDIAAAHGSVAA